MKTLIILTCILGQSILTYGQTKYTITLEGKNNLKQSINNLTSGIDVYNKRIVDKNTITFTSYKQLNNQYFDSLSSNVKTVVRESTTIAHQLKGGGNDCVSSEIICSNQSFSANSSGPGNQDLNASNEGCLYGENQSSWYYINVENTGSLTMVIDPDDDDDDYDFAVWGPFTDVSAGDNCPPISQPIRCSYSDLSDQTGFTPYLYYDFFIGQYVIETPTHNSEDEYGISFVAPMSVNAGEIYILVVDNYSNSGQPYSLSWGGSATLGCTPVILPVEFTRFYGEHKDKMNKIYWSTASEINNDYFTIERSTDNINWTKVGTLNGSGNSSETLNYSYDDHQFEQNTINYYRITQHDYDGKTESTSTIYIDNQVAQKTVVKTINLLGQEVDSFEKGLLIEVYDDGTIRKIFKQ